MESFFALRLVFTIFYTESFQVLPEKNHPRLKCQFLPKISIWRKSLLCKHSEKWLSPPPRPPSPITQGKGEGWELCNIWFTILKDHGIPFQKYCLEGVTVCRLTFVGPIIKDLKIWKIDVVLKILLLNLNMFHTPFSSVDIVDYEQVC